MKFLLNVKKHQHYLYISVFLIALFFIVNSLITDKITTVTEELIEDVVQGNLKTKQNVISFEINQLNSYINDAQNILENFDVLTENQLVSRLQLTGELAVSNEKISSSWVVLLEKDKVELATFSNNPDLLFKNMIFKVIDTFIKKLDGSVYNKIIKGQKITIERKIIAKKLANGKVVVFGYDIDLLKFWKYYSQTYPGEGGYTVLANTEGVCILHPEPAYIGTVIDDFFKTVDIKDVLKSTTKFKNNYFISNNKLIKTQTTSIFLGLEVLRYFTAIRSRNYTLILIVSFPVDINLKESIVDTKRYFLWISLLALFTFIIILVVSRLQLKKEFTRNLNFAKEKEQLTISNERYQRENAVLQLKQLKRKINPHFLFNSLNSLHVLIDNNTELSQEFVLNLAEVYRYMLEERKRGLITVKKEITFLEQYIFLQKIRFKDSLNLSIKYNDNKQTTLKKIPFLALETLVENSIKHNEITKNNPLFIEIIIENEQIVVTNNYNPRKNSNTNSHHIGLNYLKNSYEHYQIYSFKTEIKGGKFICYLPLLP